MPKSGTEIWWRLREELPYHVRLRDVLRDYESAYRWGEERYGQSANSDGSCGDWYPEIYRFHFKDERMAIEFKMRWG